MGYNGLVERKYEILAEASFGDYQGDILFLVWDANGTDPERRKGIIIAGYGSCSYCDAYDGAEQDTLDGTNPEALDQLAAGLHQSAVFGTDHELKLYLLGPDAPLRWYFHAQDFEDAASSVFMDRVKAIGQ